MEHRITGTVVTSYTDLFPTWRQLTFSSHIHTYPLKMVSIFMSQDWGEAGLPPAKLYWVFPLHLHTSLFMEDVGEGQFAPGSCFLEVRARHIGLASRHT